VSAAPASHRPSKRPAAGSIALVTALALWLPQRAHAEPAPDSASTAAPDALPTVTDEPEPPPDDDGASEANLQRAMRAFESGSANYNSAKYKDALSDFLEAASLYASPDVQYNIGLCYEKLDKPEEAIRAYEIYLKTKSEVPDRANVENRIAGLRAEIATREQQAAQQPEQQLRPPPDGQKQRKQAKALIGAGAGLTALGAAVAFGGGLGLGIAAKGRSDDLEDIQSGGNPREQSFADASALEDEGKDLEIGQIVSVAVGAAIGLTGIALIAVGAQRMAKAKRTPNVAFSPSFGARSFGLSLGGRF
jgi:tetratricopeptide (TPR) repeat protein